MFARTRSHVWLGLRYVWAAITTALLAALALYLAWHVLRFTIWIVRRASSNV